MENISLLIMSCDAYKDVIDVFLSVWYKYSPWWKYNIYLVTEKRQYKYPGVKTIAPGEISWNDRIKQALTEIDTEYVLYMQDDYFVSNNISEVDFKKIIDSIYEANLNFYKLVNYPKINNHKYDNNYLSLIPNNKRYGINLWPAIIRKEWLIKELPDYSCNPWEVEVHFLEKVKNKFTNYIDGCVVDTRNFMGIRDGIRKGKWWTPTIKYFKKNGVDINLGNRERANLKEIIKSKITTNIRQSIPTPIIRTLKKINKKFGKEYITDK